MSGGTRQAEGAVRIPGSHIQYPHESIENVGKNLTGHSQTLRGIASSVSGVRLAPESLGAIGTSHATQMSSHVSSSSSHIITKAEEEEAHATRLQQASQNMRTADEGAANAFTSIAADTKYDGKPPTGQSSTGPVKLTGNSTPQATLPQSDIKLQNGNPAENDTPTGSRPVFADPIDLTTGRMMLTQTDVELAGMLRLVLSRTHVSSYALGRWFGSAWASTVDQRLEVDDDGVHFAAEDGTLLTFPHPAIDGPALPNSGPRWPLSIGEDGGYAITKPETGQVLIFGANGGHRLPITGIADATDNWIRFGYQDTTLVLIEHSGGYRITVGTANGVITGLRLAGDQPDQDVELARYDYTDGRLSGVVNSSGRPLRFEYDDAGRIVRWVDRNGMWYRYTFDVHGHCVRAEGADGYLDATFSYDKANRVHSATDSLGRTSTYRLNERLQIVEPTDPAGNATRFEWDEFDRMLTTTDPLGRTTSYTYDVDGNVIAETRPDGSRRVAEYNDLRVPVTMVDADSAVWRQEADEGGRVTAVVEPTGARTVYTYDKAGNVATITDPLGAITRIESNAAGLPVSVTDGVGATTRYVYDRMGRVRQIVDPLGGVTVLAWTVEGLPLALTTPDGAVQRWSYDAEGNTREIVDPMGRVNRTEIGHFDLPVARTDPDGGELRYAYDTELRLTAVTNQVGQQWRYEYDAAGRLQTETDFDGRTVRYTYDAAGQLLSRTNAVGQTVTWRWDALGREIGRGTDTEQVTFAYDEAGRLVRAGSPLTELAITYDPAGRVLTETVDGRVVTSTYDAAGRRIGRRSATGAASTWEYDPAGRATALRTDQEAIVFGRDVVGREVQRRMGEMVLGQVWDARHRLTSQTVLAANQRVQSRDYRYRPDGVLASVGDELSGARDYGVDPLGRVTAVRGQGWTERYDYDATGNVTSAESPRHPAVGPREYSGTLITSAGRVRYEHDAEGRMTARHQTRPDGRQETWRYTWDALDQLVAVTAPDGQSWRYRYDAVGRRVAKQRVTPEGRVAEQVVFTWDGDQLAEQIHDGARVLVWDWAPDSQQVVSQRERSINGQQVVDQRFFAIVTDLVGTPTELVDPAGTLAWHGDASLWGTSAQPGTLLRFPGQYLDQETGLHYNRYRYYDPATGRFLTHDPLGLPAAPNSQSYVDNPTGWIDPLGLTPCPVAQLHQNPQGPSLVVQGPLKVGAPNRVPNVKPWGQIVSGQGNPSMLDQKTQKMSFTDDPQTMLETDRFRATFINGQKMDMNPANGNLNARPGAVNAMEAMGRRDPASAQYWQTQDSRDERLANDVNSVTAHTLPRLGSDKLTDANTLAGSTTKLQGMQSLLQNHPGVIIGTRHGTDDSWHFLTNNMGPLKASGVDTVYTEHIRDDAHQQMVNHYLQTGQMDPKLDKYLNTVDQNQPANANLRTTLQQAHQHNVDVQGIGGRPARRPAEYPQYSPEQLHARAGMLNTYGSQIVNNHQAALGANPGKYIVDVGSAHGYEHTNAGGQVTIQGVDLPNRVPGMGDILNVPVIRTSPTNNNVFEAM